jgi:hypothetical protein
VTSDFEEAREICVNSGGVLVSLAFRYPGPSLAVYRLGAREIAFVTVGDDIECEVDDGLTAMRARDIFDALLKASGGSCRGESLLVSISYDPVADTLRAYAYPMPYVLPAVAELPLPLAIDVCQGTMPFSIVTDWLADQVAS